MKLAKVAVQSLFQLLVKIPFYISENLEPVWKADLHFQRPAPMGEVFRLGKVVKDGHIDCDCLSNIQERWAKK